VGDTAELTTKRIKLLDVPIDILPPEDFEERIKTFFEDEGKHQIVLLDLMGFLKARRLNDFGKCVRQASLVIPVSNLIIRGARFMKKAEPIRYMPFEFIIRLLGTLEKHGQSVYYVGSRISEIQKAAKNLRDSFPGLHMVGRCAGYYRKEEEKDIILAVRKAAPTLILAGRGLPGKDRWIMVHAKDFSPGLYLYSGECFDIFAGKKRKPSRETWQKGIEWVPELFRRPWLVYRIFPILYYDILLLFNRLRKA
jgi:N-acetylglucosaminyldiphosphoundecaprenol N-acetyl-beta-D-mannosaminyltransferase